jgi:hypothetical protein
LVAEINKTQARTVRLALPAGRYLLRKPEGAFVRVGEAVVMPNTLLTVRDQDMAQVPYTEVARRGPGLPRLWQFELGMQLSSAAIQGAGLTPALAAMLMREFGALELAFGLSGGYAGFNGQALSISQYEGWVFAEGRWRAPLGLLLPYVGINVSAGLLHQTLTRDQEQAIDSTFNMRPMDDRTGPALRLAGTLGVELPLSARATLRFEISAGATGAGVEHGIRVLPAGAALLAIGVR